jgi:Ca2+-binding RTX toxin-like protein
MAIHQRRDPKTGQVIIEGDEGDDNIHVKSRMVKGHEDGVTVESLDDEGKVMQSYTLNAQEVKKGGGLSIEGGKGEDYIHVDDNVHSDLNLSGGDDDDFIVSGAGNDTIQGGQGTDFLYGGQGNDALLGGKGNDYLSGEGGNDVLYGEEGDDSMLGGEGKDTITFTPEDSYVDPGNDPGDKSDYVDIDMS